MENIQLPKTGFSALKAHFKDDFVSGFTVSLIALPLCLGIAIASGFPPLAGLITAIVGGIFASRLAVSFVTISGPAAGLIVISLGAIESLGGGGVEHGFAGYPHALGAIVVAGAIVALFGFLKVGKVGDYFPSAAVHGMLAAIGIIIIIKQIFPALGVSAPKGEILEQAADIPHVISEFNPYSLTIAGIALAILIIHPMIKIKAVKIIPAPMWVLLAVIPVANQFGPELVKFVDLPDKIFGEGRIQFPSFEKIGQGAFWIAVTGFALVSAIESLLSAKAVDSLDPYKRNANLNKDLVAMGSGSSMAAAIGGLPMISEIVRSSANINNGGKTQWANFYHGVLLMIYVLVLAFAIELIPTAALAAMLVFTGFRLAHPREFKHTLEIGLTDFIVFVVTIVGVLATDLLIGIALGIVANYLIVFIKSASIKNVFVAAGKITDNTIVFKGTLYFSNYLSIKKKIDGLLQNKEIILDFKNVTLIDHTVMHHLVTYQKELKRKGILVEMKNMSELISISNHELSERRVGIKKTAKKSLTSRQEKLLGLASEQGWNYMLRKDWNGVWDFYTVTVRRKIISLQNILVDEADGIRFSIADITTQEGARTTTEYQYITALKITGVSGVPKFYMAPETLVDKVANLFTNTDINVDSHPIFSKNCILKGENPTAVRSFFTDEILDFFEANLNYFLISNGSDLLLRRDDRFLTPKEIIELDIKAKELVAILLQANK